MNKLDESFRQVDILILPMPMRRGWAMRLLVMADMLVLSDERIVPKSVAPLGS